MVEMDKRDKITLTGRDFRKFFLRSPVGRMVVSVEPGGNFVFAEVNHAAAQYFTMPRDEISGHISEELFDKSTARQVEQAFQDCLKTKKTVTLKMLPRFSGGVRVHTFIINPLFNNKEKVRFLDVIVRADMMDGEQLQHERDDAIMLMTSLFDASGLGIIVTDHHGRIVRVNDSFLSHYGWKRQDLLGEEYVILILPDERAVSRRLYRAFIDHGYHGSRELQIMKKDGSIADIVVTTTLLELSRSRRFMISTVLDVTERRNMVRYLKRAKEEADSANQAKSAFLASMSHELRTPLNAIIGFAELMKNKMFGPLGSARYEDYMSDIHLSALHLLEIINDVLDMSKIEAGKVDLIEGDVSISHILESVMRIMDDRAQAMSIDLDFRVEDDAPNVRADQRLLRQIMINLVSNSVKFSEKGKTVKVYATKRENGGLRLMVNDEGCGIPVDKMKLVMEPFGQVKDPRHYAVQGTGLGLPLAKAMTEMHDGTLKLESIENEGTTIYIDFPPERSLPVRKA